MIMENTQKKTLWTLLKAAWNEWRSDSRESQRIKAYSEVISLHAKQTGSFGRADHESGVMQAYFRACKAKEAEVTKNVRAMVFGASPEEKAKLKENLMSLGIDLDAIITEADAADGITNEVMVAEGLAGRKVFEVDVVDMSKEEAIAHLEKVQAQLLENDEFPKTTDSAGNIVTGKAAEELKAMRMQDAYKANRKDIWPDYTKSVTGAATSELFYNSSPEPSSSSEERK
jgi:hypothetical protein